MAYTWSDLAPRVKAALSESQKALALRFDVTESTMSRWLSGHTTPDPIVALRLTELAGLDLYILGGVRPSAATMLREEESRYGQAPPFPAPLLRRSVAAGEPQLEVIPEGIRPYYFRREWLMRRGWSGRDDDERFGVYRLGEPDIADSMFPTIQPRSVLLVDRRPCRRPIPPRSIWIVRVEAGSGDDPQLPLLVDEDRTPSRLTTKRVTQIDHQLVLESDNREARHAPRILRCRPSDLESVLVGRVIWFATELE